MPIRYEPPQPLAPGLSAAYGAAEVASRNLPAIASLYANRNRLEAEAGQFQAQLAQRAALSDQATNQRAAEFGAEVSGRGREFAQQLTERRAEYAASREPGPRDYFLAQAEQAQQARRAELQNWLSQQEVGQAEQVRLQRMQNSLAEVMASPTLQPHEKEALALQIRTGIDPVKQRLERQQGERQIALTDQAVQQGERIKKQELRQAELDAKTFDQRTAYVDDGAGGRVGFFQKSVGEWAPIPRERGEGGEAKAQAEQVKVENEARKEWMKANEAARRELTAQRRETEKDAEGAVKLRYPDLQDEAGFEDRVFALTGRKLGYSRPGENMPGVDEHARNRLRERGGGRGEQGTGGGGDYGRQQPKAEPFDPRNPPPALAPEVKRLTDTADRLRDLPGLSRGEQAQGVQASATAAAVFARNGGNLAAMPPEDRALFEQAMNLQAALIRLARERAPKGQPRPAAGRDPRTSVVGGRAIPTSFLK